MKKLPLIFVGVFVLLIAGGVYFVRSYNQNQDADIDVVTSQKIEDENLVSEKENETKIETEAIGLSSEEETEKQLLYLIEEEKLAHDVYTVMFEEYGAKVFGNILESESKHQEKVLALLNARNIDDPRSEERGVFTDASLQKFYDDLITQGLKSETEAYKVGVMIEETDIADLSRQLATTEEQDVIDTLESLRKGSENHLRAFNKQL